MGTASYANETRNLRQQCPWESRFSRLVFTCSSRGNWSRIIEWLILTFCIGPCFPDRFKHPVPLSVRSLSTRCRDEDSAPGRTELGPRSSTNNIIISKLSINKRNEMKKCAAVNERNANAPRKHVHYSTIQLIECCSSFSLTDLPHSG